MIVPDENIDFPNWANSLRIDLNTQEEIPYVREESEWREWGNILIGSPVFQRFGIPRTDSFSEWREWGKIVTKYF